MRLEFKIKKKTNFKRPFTKATDDKLREEAHQRFLEAQNSTSGYDLVDSLLNSEGGRLLQSYIGDTGVNELIDTVRNVYNKAVKTYLRSLKDKFTYTTIHCEKCSFDFNPGFESYKTLSAGAVGEQVKSKFSILPKKVTVSHDFGIHEWVLSEWVEDLCTPDVYYRYKPQYGIYINDTALMEKNNLKDDQDSRVEDYAEFDLSSSDNLGLDISTPTPPQDINWSDVM